MTLTNAVVGELQKLVGRPHVIHDLHDLTVFERDGSSSGALPDAVVLPADRDQVVRVMSLAARHGIPVVPRGAGTGLSGGAVTLKGGIALQLSRMRKILEIDQEARTAVVEPGVVNADLQQAVGRRGLFYAPDPSSQKACTIGGNAAENSGGPHCLYYGVTTNHVIGLEVVFADGSTAWLGGDAPDRVGLDLLGVMVGSEGTLGTITQVKVRLLPLPESVVTLMAAFPTIETASHAVSDVIGHGIVPAALEMMDQVTIGAVEAHYRAGYPVDAGAVLLVDVEGLDEIGEHYRLPVANVFHAGDGNLHPNILFDLRDQGIMSQVEKAGEEMLHAVVELGGTLSGEHGIGIEKNAFMPWIYGPDDLDAMLRVKRVFDSKGLFNPGKIFPDPEREPKLTVRAGFCAEGKWW